MYPLETIPIHSCLSIQLVDLLVNEEIARARVSHVVSGTPGDYNEFIHTQLQGCLAGILVTSVAFFLFEINLHHVLHFLYSLFQLL